MGRLKRIRRRKMIEQGGRCYYCGLPMWDDADTTAARGDGMTRQPLKELRCTAEHLHARSDGGGDTDHNIVAACWYCNTQRHRRKRPLSPEEHRMRVQERMAAGKWLAAQVSHGALKAKSQVT
jgi:5-methylcytosine-specific restriction endonuclease McrA